MKASELDLRCGIGSGRNWYCRFKCQPGSQPLQSVGTSRNIRSATEVSRRGGVLRSVGTKFKLLQELLRHSSLRSTLDIYTQAITPAERAAQRAVLSLVFSPEENLSSSLEAPTPTET
jgi:hypothetical protein